MNIYNLLASGEFHPINGEDFQYHQYIGQKWLIAGVMDGCSSGKESQFASLLYGKSLRKSCRMLPDMKNISEDFDVDFMEKEVITSFLLGQLFEDVKKMKKALFLDLEEILSTIILMVYDVQDHAAMINVSGDGVIVCNKAVEEIDQNNIPDYLGYHLDVKFEEWYKNHTKTLEFDHINDISISTDGIGKLRPNSLLKSKSIDPIDYFLVQSPGGSSQQMLYNKYINLLENEHYIAYDDISIIRLIP